MGRDKVKTMIAKVLILVAGILFLAAFTVAEEKQNPEAVKHYNAGVEFTRTGDFEKAVESYKASLELDPENVQTLYGLGYAYRKLDQLEAAIEYLSKAVKINPRYVDAHYELGLAYWTKKEYDESINQFVTVCNFGPEAGSKYSKSYYSIGRLYHIKKELDQALEALQMSVAMDPEYAEAHYYLGEVYMQKEALNSAIGAYQQATVLDSTYAQAFYKLGLVYKEDGQFEKAVDSYQKVIALEPNSKIARDSKYRLAVVYNALRRYQEAIAVAGEYLERKPTDAKALVALGEAYENLGQLEKAIDAYTKAAKDSRWNQYATYKIDQLKKSMEEE